MFVELNCEPLRAMNAILKYALSVRLCIVIFSKRGNKKGTGEGGGERRMRRRRKKKWRSGSMDKRKEWLRFGVTFIYRHDWAKKCSE